MCVCARFNRTNIRWEFAVGIVCSWLPPAQFFLTLSRLACSFCCLINPSLDSDRLKLHNREARLGISVTKMGLWPWGLTYKNVKSARAQESIFVTIVLEFNPDRDNALNGTMDLMNA